MPSIQLPPKATSGTAQAMAAGQQPARPAVDPQAQQPAPKIWGGALSRMFPGQLQPRTMNFTPGSTNTTAAGAASFGQARPAMMPKAAAAKVTRRPWTINGADALTSMQYYSRKKKDGSTGRASMTMSLPKQKTVTEKTSELSPFAGGFVRGCLAKELPVVAIKVAADNLSALSSDIRLELEPVVKWAEAEIEKQAFLKPLMKKITGKAMQYAPEAVNSAQRFLGRPGVRNVTSTLSGAMEGSMAGGLVDSFTNNTGMTDDSSWGTLLGAGAGAVGLGRPMRQYLAKSRPGVAKSLYGGTKLNSSGGIVGNVTNFSNKWGLPVMLGEHVGGLAVNRGLERAAQGAGFSNFGDAQQMLQQYNSGDVMGLATGLWGRMSPAAKAGLLGAGAMAGGGLLSGLTGSAMPAQIGTLGGAAMMAPMAMQGISQYMGGGQPQQQALPAPGSASAPTARDEYALQMQGG